jgi:hypothetical protein
VAEGDLDGATIPPIKQGEPISAADAIAHARARKEEGDRIETGLPGVDWVFNGGLPTKGTALFCSPAGTGKTTLAWELGRMLARKKIETLFLSSEQTIEELGAQFERLGAAPAKHFILVSETDQSAILRVIEKSRAQVVFLDSLHEVEGVTDEGGYDLGAALFDHTEDCALVGLGHQDKVLGGRGAQALELRTQLFNRLFGRQEQRLDLLSGQHAA